MLHRYLPDSENKAVKYNVALIRVLHSLGFDRILWFVWNYFFFKLAKKKKKTAKTNDLIMNNKRGKKWVQEPQTKAVVWKLLMKLKEGHPGWNVKVNQGMKTGHGIAEKTHSSFHSS